MKNLFLATCVCLTILIGGIYFAVEYTFGHPSDGDPHYAVNQILKEVAGNTP